MSGTPALLKLVTLLYGLQDCVNLQNLVLEPHLDVDKGVCEGSRQIIEVLLQSLVVFVLEKQLFFGQLVLFWEVLLAAEVRIDLWAIGQHRVELVLIKELV